MEDPGLSHIIWMQKTQEGEESLLGVIIVMDITTMICSFDEIIMKVPFNSKIVWNIKI